MGKSLQSQALEKLGKDWSQASTTRVARLQTVTNFSEFVAERFGLERIDSLKPAHIAQYVQALQDKGLSNRTICNRLAHVRELASSIGKANIVPRSNAELGVERSVRADPRLLNTEKVAEIRQTLSERAATGDRTATMMVATAEMREAFGLRHKEAMMSSRVINGRLQVEGAKGGRPRELPIDTDAKRSAVSLSQETAKVLGNANGRPIPPEMNLKQALQAESRTWHELGGTREANASMHLARHDYCQRASADGKTNAEIQQDLGHGDDRSLSAYK